MAWSVNKCSTTLCGTRGGRRQTTVTKHHRFTATMHQPTKSFSPFLACCHVCQPWPFSILDCLHRISQLWPSIHPLFLPASAANPDHHSCLSMPHLPTLTISSCLCLPTLAISYCLPTTQSLSTLVISYCLHIPPLPTLAISYCLYMPTLV